MLRQDCASRKGASTDCVSPIHTLTVGQVDRLEDRIDDAVENRIFVGHVVVERHRLDAQLLGHPSHRDGLDTTRVGNADRTLDHASSVQRLSRLP